MTEPGLAPGTRFNCHHEIVGTDFVDGRAGCFRSESADQRRLRDRQSHRLECHSGDGRGHFGRRAERLAGSAAGQRGNPPGLDQRPGGPGLQGLRLAAAGVRVRLGLGRSPGRGGGLELAIAGPLGRPPHRHARHELVQGGAQIHGLDFACAAANGLLRRERTRPGGARGRLRLDRRHARQPAPGGHCHAQSEPAHRTGNVDLCPHRRRSRRRRGPGGLGLRRRRPRLWLAGHADGRRAGPVCGPGVCGR